MIGYSTYNMESLSTFEEEFGGFEDVNLNLFLFKEEVMANVFLINQDRLQVVGKFQTKDGAVAVGEKAKFEALVVTKPKDLEVLGTEGLTTLFKNLTKKDPEKVEDKPMIAEIMKVMKSADLNKIPDAKDAPKGKGKNGEPDKPKTPSKIGILRQLFKEKDSWKKTELIAKTGYDGRNLNTALAILKNPNRTKPEHLLVTKYDRKEETFSIVVPE